MTFHFRMRFTLPIDHRIEHLGAELTLWSSQDESCRVWLKADGPIKDATELAVYGGPYEEESGAESAGREWRGRIERAFVVIGLPADFGDRRRSTGSFGPTLRTAITQQTGRPLVMNDYGLITFNSSPWPLFGSSTADATIGKPGPKVTDAISSAVAGASGLDQKQSLAYSLFSTAEFQHSPDARFLLYTTAIEALSSRGPRSDVARQHIEQLIERTKHNRALAPRERESICSSLSGLQVESISQAGRKLASSLGQRKYMGQDPVTFFTHCYKLRSKLTHGSNPPLADIQETLPAIRRFVLDLLAVIR
ncbi:hypothetical protein AB0I55_29260 [Actinocatenispora sera]|uniref:hypothetical protein n=1 Tax=Actinocatenispora sera TaxID=390989 RepID=UPI0034023924